MWRCKKCGGNVREAEYKKNYYEIENDGSIGKFIEESELSESKYFCTRCGIKSSYTLGGLKRIAKWEDN
ncbi:Uncharacterised protein [Sebaldella termitidis]|uniref:Uncharacterized protein n=1 Tax=Sebaldella termitidis (strain ATCC 33386 / NCTC 11300) TaxID=526218 RepID=D1AQY6_SEBTE|nr:hypothetical protein [Sebaldella termitidis]ACZ07674.1 hypothetical protein Sterm_0802 [Sebaldella termitidis ATCC 33386]SUI22970.1 Uncharacterised protein [Sebaldella termitidis]